jgi:archaellum component FlaD/FlaE
MSSDSEESHSSAPRNDRDDDAQDYFDRVPPIDQEGTLEESTNDNDGEEEDQGDELQSLDNGSNDLTFHRVRSRGAQQEEEKTPSELSFRPKVERPDSPQSESIPDDTPSIQVGHIGYA